MNERKQKMGFSVSLDQLDFDEYQVYVEYEGKAYHLKNEIRIEKKTKKQPNNKKG